MRRNSMWSVVLLATLPLLGGCFQAQKGVDQSPTNQRTAARETNVGEQNIDKTGTVIVNNYINGHVYGALPTKTGSFEKVQGSGRAAATQPTLKTDDGKTEIADGSGDARFVQEIRFGTLSTGNTEKSSSGTASGTQTASPAQAMTATTEAKLTNDISMSVTLLLQGQLAIQGQMQSLAQAVSALAKKGNASGAGAPQDGATAPQTMPPPAPLTPAGTQPAKTEPPAVPTP